MEENNQKLKIHFWISLIIFVGLFLIRFIFAKIPMGYGYGSVTLGSLFLLLFGFYLIFVSSLYFKSVFNSWKNNNPWKKDIIKSYLLLLLFCAFIVLLYISGGREGPMELFYEMVGNPIDLFFDDIPNMFFMIGLSLVFPTSIYTAFLSIKSLITAKNENKSYSLGITLLIMSLILLVASFFSFFIISSFWIQGGIRL